MIPFGVILMNEMALCQRAFALDFCSRIVHGIVHAR
jgi:hypothetical protein